MTPSPTVLTVLRYPGKTPYGIADQEQQGGVNHGFPDTSLLRPRPREYYAGENCGIAMQLQSSSSVSARDGEDITDEILYIIRQRWCSTRISACASFAGLSTR